MGQTSILSKSLCLTLCLLRFTPVSTTAGNTELPEFLTSEVSHVESEPERGAEFMLMREHEARPKTQFKTAEIADAVLGVELPADPAGMESLVPKSVRQAQASCEDGACGAHAVVASADGQGAEEAEPVVLGMVHVDSMAEERNSSDNPKQHKVNCDKRNTTGLESYSVHVLNTSQDLMDFLNANSTECSLVLFYTPWCQFSANLAPHFNALPRVFPAIHFVALDASQHSSLSTRFGTVAVPNILLFQGVKPMARFNQTERTLETLTAFVANQTGFETVRGERVTDEDLTGPLPSVPVKSVDWLLVFSILFISSFTIYAILRTDSIRWLIPGQEHEHQD